MFYLEKEKYERDSLEVGDEWIKEIELDAKYYIHTAILKAQIALTKDNINEGFLQYIQLIEHIEILCRSNKMLDDKYKEFIQNFLDSDEYKNEQNNTIKLVKLAHKKLEGIMVELADTKPIYQELKL